MVLVLEFDVQRTKATIGGLVADHQNEALL